MSYRLVAPSHLERHFVGLLQPGETVIVTEGEKYGRTLLLHLQLADRRAAMLALSLDLLMSSLADVRTIFMYALERLRAHLAEQPAETTWRLPSLREDYMDLYARDVYRRALEYERGWPPPSVPPDTAKILVEFAKANKREEFDWLAQSAGVKPEQLEELWRGTLARLGP